MTVLLIVLGIFIYLLIGGIIGYAVDFDDDLRVICVLIWPFVLIIFSIVGICFGMAKLGEMVVDFLTDSVFKPIGEYISKQIDSWRNKEDDIV